MTTSAMEFGQETINVVLNETGQFARFNAAGTALVVNGNTLLHARGAPGILPDGVKLVDVATTNSTTCTITSASASFTSADIGKVCAVHSRVSTSPLQNARYGVISSVNSATSCVATLNSAPGVLTNAFFVYGSDNTSALQAALDTLHLSTDKSLTLPAGIICVSASITLNGGCNLTGAGRTYTEKNWWEVEYTGTTICMCGYEDAPVLAMGDDTYGPTVSNLNVDGCGIVSPVIGMTGRCGYLSEVTAMKSLGGYDTTYVVNMGPGSMVKNCTLIGGNSAHVCNVGGDCQLTGSNIYGAGTGYALARLSGSNDALVSQNHFWTDSQFNASTIVISAWQTWNSMNSLLIIGNEFDTAKGKPHIKISVEAGCNLRGVSITNNVSFNNDDVTTPYPWIDIDVAATGSLRGLIVADNNVLGSWYTETSGVQSALIDGSGIAGSCLGTIVTGNYLDRPATGDYISFTPTVSANNVRVSAAGTETVF